VVGEELGNWRNEMTYEEFETFCNSLNSGHLKRWKANSMIEEFVGGKFEDDRLVDWVHGCLRMEGFMPSDCNKVVAWFENSQPKKRDD
jgi:hypothetical protein